MPMRNWWARAARLPGHPHSACLQVDAADWYRAANDAAAAGGQLLALWGTPRRGAVLSNVRAAFFVNGQLLILQLPIPDDDLVYRGLEAIFPAAARMQRAVRDLVGPSADSQDKRPWLRHAQDENYAFVRVEGDGVHEIAVGPVHAGTIEPGHFRFSVVGEKVLRLEERLGFAHKGIEHRFTEMPALDAHRLAARVSGDSGVAFSWALCQALEGLGSVEIPPRAAWLRALCLELERVQNHVGDLGALGNDAGFAFGLMQFSRHKEQLLRTMQAAMGQRYLLDAIVPGGVAFDLSAVGESALAAQVEALGPACAQLRDIYDEHAGVRDRFVGAGIVAPELAKQLGLAGLAGRASGQPLDLRIDAPTPPYDLLQPARSTRTNGDVAARVAVRFDEIQVSLNLITRLLRELPGGAVRAEVPMQALSGSGVGLIEGWRGPVLVALDCDAGAIARCHPHDPSWQNWPVLEHAIIGNIVPDFPLINKSFNLSYSGHDL